MIKKILNNYDILDGIALIIMLLASTKIVHYIFLDFKFIEYVKTAVNSLYISLAIVIGIIIFLTAVQFKIFRNLIKEV